MHSLRVAKCSAGASVAIVTGLAALLCGCGGGGGGTSKPVPSAPATLRLSSAFVAGATIPNRFTCDGQDQSPPLAWSGVPSTARELALSLDDPDAPGGDFTHWLLYRIGLRPATIAAGGVPAGAALGRNSFGHNGYNGPCPPKGDKPHRYRFVLYALSRPLGLEAGASPDEFRAAVAPAAIAEGTLTGTYSR